MRVSEVIGEVFASRGVEAFFGLVGSGNFPVVESLCESGVKFYSSRHECGAVMMADGYARASGRVGVCTVHQGPGFTNALTGLVEAAKNRTPLVLVAADTPGSVLWSNFKIDQGGVATTLGAVPERVRSVETAARDAARALRRARVERRPVVLNVPLDLVERECPEGTVLTEPPELLPPRPAVESVAEAVELLAASERPVIVAGKGAADSAGARDSLEKLAERAGALLATSAMAHGLFSGSEYALGIAGGFASPLAVELLGEADAVLAFGASLNHWTARHGRLFDKEAGIVQVDLDAEAIGSLHRADVGIVGDAAATAGAISEEMERRGVRKTGFRTPEIRRRIARERWRDVPFEDEGTDEYIDPRTFSVSLDDALPAERTVSTDSGHFLGYPAMYLEVPDEKGFVFPNAFQSVGLGLASGIGAAVARPERLSVAAIGDGGALMALGEIETAARYRLPMVVAVYNDAAYGAEVHHFGPMGRDVAETQFPDTNFAAVARASGAEGITVRRPEDLAPVREWLDRRDGPLVIDAKVNPRTKAEWLEEAFKAH